MKKSYLILKLLVALSMLAPLNCSAQLSGNYTIDQSAPASSTNFVNFNALASALTASGVTGPVNVLVLNGPYNEQVTFTQHSGASATNRVKIDGNNQLLTFLGTNTQPWTMRLNGADFMTIDNLDMSGTSSQYALVCLLTNSSNNNIFSACSFSCNPNVTGSQTCPFSWSSSSTSPTGSGSSSGDNTLVTDCHMFSGYYGISMWGLTSLPYNQGNVVQRCSVQDFYNYGIYTYYMWESKLIQNVVERPTRTTLTSFIGIYTNYNWGGIIDGNIIQKPWEMNPTQTSYYGYGIYAYGYSSPMPPGAQKIIVRNNIIRNFRSNYYFYGILSYYFVNTHHNTLILDNASSTNNSISIYGIYCFTQAGMDGEIRNNLVYMSMGGSAPKYGIYIGSPATTVVNGNAIWSQGPGANHYIGWYNSGHTTWASWQSAGADATGSNVNPNFVNNLTDAHPTNAALNNTGLPLGVLFDQENAVRNPTTPDVGALEFLTPTCAGQPNMTISGPSYSLCPGETANFGIGNLSSDLGYTYAWYTSSMSIVGPWTPITGTSITNAVPNVTNTTWASVVITCTAPGGSSIQPVAQVNVAGPTTSLVPYYESFEGIGLNNRLPNCSWFAPGLGGSAKTYTSAQSGNILPNTGNALASFNNSNSNPNYYYTNGIFLNANVTYSASLWYMTDFSGSTNWNMKILLGNAQNTTALTQTIASVAPAVSPFYKSLSNTFSVATSGMYYVAVMGQGASGGAPNLVWDDLRIEIPCQAGNNSPALTLSANNTTICSGEGVILTVGGADTHTWSSGAVGLSTTEYPNVNTNYMVIGTNTLTGCNSAASIFITVKPSPVISLFAIPPVVCAGSNVNLQASGAISYSWTTQQNGSNINVVPTTAMNSYSVRGTGPNGCVSESQITVGIHQLPTVTGVPSSYQVCPQDALTFTGNGANSYQWVSTSPAMTLLGTSVTFNLTSAATFTVTGTDNNGCQDTDVFTIQVDACTGLASFSASGFKVFPNPTSGILNISMERVENASLTLTDVSGRMLMAEKGVNQLDISQLAGGVYYLRIENGEHTAVQRIVKQ
jgi:hypothetical protein